MNRKFAAISAGLALALAATTANAAVNIVSVQQNKPMGYSFTPSSVITFDNRAVGSSANFTTGIATFAGGGFIEDGTVRYAYMTPANDATNYLALGNTKNFKQHHRNHHPRRCRQQVRLLLGLDRYLQHRIVPAQRSHRRLLHRQAGRSLQRLRWHRHQQQRRQYQLQRLRQLRRRQVQPGQPST